MGTAKIHLLCSFRGGSGKTSLTANLGILLANAGMRVALVDMALNAPGLHIPFGLTSRDLSRTLQDSLAIGCELRDVALDLNSQLNLSGSGKLYLLPASAGVHSLARLMRHGYDPQEFASALRQLVEDLSLDLVLLDTHPGLSEELLLAMLLAEGVSLVLRGDSSDLEGTGALLQVARKLGKKHPHLILNQMPPGKNAEYYNQTLQVEVAGSIPGGQGLDPLFCLRQAEGAPAQALKAISHRLLR
jgi:MinD-like ATPase involved in chromosome partitioning or flagellar assembly